MTKLIYGVGYNPKGEYAAQINGKNSKAYQTWIDMLKRCYCPKRLKKRVTYKDVYVCEEWHNFQNFADWYFKHPYSDKGYCLDKDLLTPNNKVYSPNGCCFVPIELNSLLLARGNDRGIYPQGVSFRKDTKKLQAYLSTRGKNKRLGYFDTVEDAYQAYKTAKERHVKNMALKWANRIEWDVFVALMSWELKTK